MQAYAGLLTARIASHGLAACSRAGAALVGRTEWRAASSSAAPAAEDSSALPKLTPEQRQQLPRLLQLLRQPAQEAQQLAVLTHLSVSYRDLSMALTSLNARDKGFEEPLADDIMEPMEQPRPDSANYARRGTYLPMRDVDEFDQNRTIDGKDAPEEPELSTQYMDKVSAWAAMQPSHVEVSHVLSTGVNLFPPTEAAYPTYVDFDAAMRLLDHHRSRKRMRLSRRLLRRQDKYQLKTWEHHPGEA
ncbi:hypothetical protein HYH03_011330 [Edaphochlamys debaryana]|uniref:Uncharacterized protein n=1 Tax=Edaphochlamys debaryana TaxID=47281 RepID=A0A835XTY9_9CHLO|nr:hypothetical protein HYH03_011330 [Edaphochlamys debaryana]|eukprot:KAG2490203.1 hypothetical protein HYH03_011330 [Edaphochlamys debaryana]